MHLHKHVEKSGFLEIGPDLNFPLFSISLHNLHNIHPPFTLPALNLLVGF